MSHTKQTQTVKMSELKAGPIRQEVLPDGFIVRLQVVKEILKEVETSSLEQALSNFQRDLNSVKELEIFEAIATHYQDYVSTHPDIDLPTKKQVFSKLLLSTLGM